MTDDHVDEELLALYAENPSMVPDADTIEAHLAGCVECGESVTRTREFIRLLQTDDVWWTARQLTSSSSLDSIRRYATRIAEEDDRAQQLVSSFIDEPLRFLYANIETKKRFHTGGVVRLLITKANETCELDPLHALALAEAAKAIAERLPDDYYPASAIFELRGTAAKEIANACRYLGRFDQAYEALRFAENAYKHLVNASAQTARLYYVRSTLLWKQQKYEEALVAVRTAKKLFRDLRDDRGFTDSSLVEGNLLVRLGRIAEARIEFANLHEEAKTAGNTDLQARTANNLGNCDSELGTYNTASAFLYEALGIYSELKRDTEAARVRWKLAQILLATGKFAEAEAALRLAQTELQRRGMEGDASLAKLDLAEALLMQGGRWREVKAVCSELVEFFRNAEMITGRLTAVAFLDDAAHQERLSARDIRRVRHYLMRAAETPDLLFHQPDDRDL